MDRSKLYRLVLFTMGCFISISHAEHESISVIKFDPITIESGGYALEVIVNKSSQTQNSKVELTNFNRDTYSLSTVRLTKQQLDKYIQLLQEAQKELP